MKWSRNVFVFMLVFCFLNNSSGSWWSFFVVCLFFIFHYFLKKKKKTKFIEICKLQEVIQCLFFSPTTNHRLVLQYFLFAFLSFLLSLFPFWNWCIEHFDHLDFVLIAVLCGNVGLHSVGVFVQEPRTHIGDTNCFTHKHE